jgi:hypothetical protein
MNFSPCVSKAALELARRYRLTKSGFKALAIFGAVLDHLALPQMKLFAANLIHHTQQLWFYRCVVPKPLKESPNDKKYGLDLSYAWIKNLFN